VHEANLQKNTVEVKVEIEDPVPLLKPEMLARVRFLAESAGTGSRQRILVPERLLGATEGARTSLWVVEERDAERGVARLRPVELGETRVDGWREVTVGLRAGDWLISAPPAGLSAGDAVTIEGEDER
jgi:hypothetical protein